VSFNYRSSLQRTMIIYFLLIGFASSLVGVEFILDTQKQELRYELLEGFQKLSRDEIRFEDAFQPIRMLRNKAIVMVFVILCVVVIVLTMFIKNVTEPLQHMIDVSREIARGDLSKSINIAANNELAELGNVINDLTTNMQEMILLADEVCASGVELVGELSASLADGGLDPEHTGKLQAAMEVHDRRVRLLQGIIHDVSLFKIGRG
jgi:methyl-accepting chemotaxis protein